KTNAHHFAVLTLNAVDGQPVPQSSRLLLTAAGDVENTGMGWNADHTSVGTSWGSAPTLCEGVAARVIMATRSKIAKVYTLDGSGTRVRELPVSRHEGQLSFDIAPQDKTIWY